MVFLVRREIVRAIQLTGCRSPATERLMRALDEMVRKERRSIFGGRAEKSIGDCLTRIRVRGALRSQFALHSPVSPRTRYFLASFLPLRMAIIIPPHLHALCFRMIAALASAARRCGPSVSARAGTCIQVRILSSRAGEKQIV